MSKIIISPSFVPAPDINFCFPVPKRLETERVALIPFDPAEHAEAAYNATKGDGDNVHGSWTWIPIPPIESVNDFIQLVWEKWVKPMNNTTLFAVLDKTKGEVFAGLIGYMQASATDLSLEIGPVITFPAFQGTCVTTNSVGLLLHYALDLPSDGGLGPSNLKSIRAAERMGFQKEAIHRWSRVLTPQKAIETNGKAVREGDPRGPDHLGRDTIILGLCWDDWESGGKALTDVAIERRK
ncbi:hypothetical protein C8J56DRAFT_935796 [Mycena floridula]|nr:hypothetical protein C8J56DRAFT_935796 [Mycena floridula]